MAAAVAPAEPGPRVEPGDSRGSFRRLRPRGAGVLLDVTSAAISIELDGRGEDLRSIRARLATWIRACDIASGVEPGVDLAGSRSRGWRVTGLDVARDYQGLAPFGLDAFDLGRWVGFTSSEPSAGRLGRNPIELLITQSIGEADHSLPAWGLFGAFEPARAVTSIKYSLARRGLDLEAAGLDVEQLAEQQLRDPATATGGPLLRQLWAYLASSRRMIEPSTATRRKRCELDRRWVLISGGEDQRAKTFRCPRSRARARARPICRLADQLDMFAAAA